MPTTYAHYLFGQDVLANMDDRCKKACLDNIDIYNYGVHGPDIFFYDLLHSDVTQFGTKMHHKSGREVFTSFKETYLKNASKDAMLAYILGFLSHFTLDATAHSYVEAKRTKANITHNKVEAQWDCHLYRKNHLDIKEVDRSQSLKASKKTASIIALFFPFDENTIYRTNKSQHSIINALNYRFKARYDFFQRVLKGLNIIDFADLLLNVQEDPVCKDSNLRLDKLKEKALNTYPVLYKSLMNFIDNGQPLDAFFDHDFEQWPNYLDIPILNYENELNYIVK